jgi:4-hydroxybenzoyl-CoA thioesterase
MSRTTTYSVNIHFGDCDPAGIVFFPNFARWMDAASLSYFMQCGVPPWREFVKTTGVVGTPVLETNTKFLKSATYGETIEIHTSVVEWRGKVFVQKHEVRRGEDLLCESREVRAFVIRDPANPDRLKAIPAPDIVRQLCV